MALDRVTLQVSPFKTSVSRFPEFLRRQYQVRPPIRMNATTTPPIMMPSVAAMGKPWVDEAVVVAEAEAAREVPVGTIWP